MTRLVVVVCLTFVGACSLLGESRAQPGRGGPGSVADIAVFLVDGSSDDDLTAVSELLFVSTPYTNSRGEERIGDKLIDGLFGVDWDYVDFALYLRVFPGASENRVQEIIEMLSADRRVDRIERHYLVPSHA